jgi:hypothetical protein
MDWSEAEEVLENESKIRRKSWPSDWYAYRTYFEGAGRFELRLTRPGDQMSFWEPSTEDKAAEDWEVVK